MKRTPWFSCETPPVLAGWYEMSWLGLGMPCDRLVYWDGRRWLLDGFRLYPFQRDQWRGLTEPAK